MTPPPRWMKQIVSSASVREEQGRKFHRTNDNSTGQHIACAPVIYAGSDRARIRVSRAPMRSHSRMSNSAASPVKSGTSSNHNDPILIKTTPCRTPTKKNITAKIVNESPISKESLKSLLSRKSARHSSLLTAGNPPSSRAAITNPSETGSTQSRIRMIHTMHLLTFSMVDHSTFDLQSIFHR